jgi:hypothetical protein
MRKAIVLTLFRIANTLEEWSSGLKRAAWKLALDNPAHSMSEYEARLKAKDESEGM